MISSRRRAAVAGVVTALALAACGGKETASEKVLEQVLARDGVEADIDLDNDTGEVTIRTPDGEVRTSSEIPADWPDVVPLPDDFKAQSGGSLGDANGRMLTVSGGSSKSIAELDAFYAAALGGWTEALRYEASGSVNVTYQRGTETAQFNFSPGDDDTALTISYVVEPGSGDGAADAGAGAELATDAENLDLITDAISGEGEIPGLDQVGLESKGDAIVFATGAERYEIDGSTIHVYFGESASVPAGIECMVVTGVLSDGETAVVHRGGNSTPC